MEIKINEIAAEIHKHLVTHKTHGYTQGSGRWGGSKKETIEVQGYKFTLGLNDYDCSSSYITAWILALSITPYKGVLGTMSQSTKGAISTRNIVKVFKDSGLFTIRTYNAANRGKSIVGDGFIKESSHVGMYQGDCKTSEFLINEKGTILGGAVGDQTGRESMIRSATAYPWEKIVHYNGKADFTVETKPTTTTTAKTVGQLAQEVIDGKHGNGDARKASLGSQYEAVQKRVNELLAKEFKVKVTTALLNVRAGAGTSYKVNGTVKKNDVLVVSDSKKVNGTTWYKLKSGKGWISGKFAKKI